ncbi:MAG TPA: protein translocase subunit SecF [Myxococcota bacterium]|nr:protein translocase subunit SecF [Myxococcota bacterium]
MELFKTKTHIDFVRQMPFMVAFSITIIVLSLASMAFKGFNFSIDFVGGTVIELQAPPEAADVDEAKLRGIMDKLGQPDATIVRLGKPEEREFRISLRGSQETDRDLSVNLLKGIGDSLGAPVVAKSVESVGPRVGGELRRAGVQAIILSWIGILIYVWFRFEWQYAPGAVLALVHDVCFTAGLFSLFGWEFDMNVLAALLVIIGYSMNDTIVIYDRIRETVATRGTTELESVVNEAINATLSRTVLTSGLTQLVVVAILLVGGPVLRGFALALFIGIVIGTYSSIYVASAVLIWLARRYGHVVQAPKPSGQRRDRARRATTTS